MDGGLVIVGAIIAGIYYWIKEDALKDNKNIVENNFKEISDFTPSQQYTSADGLKVIGYDENRNKFAITSLKSQTAFSKAFSYVDILSVEIFYDGNTVTKTNRVSQIGGALIGGLVLGGVGAVVGGLSGKTSSKKEVKKIELRIIVNDKQSPIQDIVFLNTKCKDWTPLYKESERSVRHWFAITSLLIEEADKEDSKNSRQPILDTNKNNSLADTLNDLNELFQKGILTEAEFSKAKQNALNQ